MLAVRLRYWGVWAVGWLAGSFDRYVMAVVPESNRDALDAAMPDLERMSRLECLVFETEATEPIRQSDLNYYQLYKSVNPENRIFFELERTDMPFSRSALNVITPFGGMILEGYPFFWA